MPARCTEGARMHTTAGAIADLIIIIAIAARRRRRDRK
jgi:aromatic ring hydroxylase